jgi:hypothetical protein
MGFWPLSLRGCRRAKSSTPELSEMVFGASWPKSACLSAFANALLSVQIGQHRLLACVQDGRGCVEQGGMSPALAWRCKASLSYYDMLVS